MGAPGLSLSTGGGLLHGPSGRALVGGRVHRWCSPGRSGPNDGKFYLAVAGYPSDLLCLTTQSGELLASSRRPSAMGLAVKLLVQALESRGCPLNLSRHVSCEDCTHKVNGGFDPINKQVVVCQNNSKYKAVACSVLAHELTHMFDYCRAKVDFTNLEHLACTEIRAANFFHCSFMSALAEGDTSPFDYKMTHQECVRRKALWSVLVVRNIKREEGEAVVDKVFDRCYSDLEPFGRRLRPKSKDFERALGEGPWYGYAPRETSS